MRTHVKHIYAKLNVHSSKELLGLIEVDDRCKGAYSFDTTPFFDAFVNMVSSETSERIRVSIRLGLRGAQRVSFGLEQQEVFHARGTLLYGRANKVPARGVRRNEELDLLVLSSGAFPDNQRL